MGLVKEMLGSDTRSRLERFIRSRTMAVGLPSGDTLCRVLDEYMFEVDLRDQSVAPHLVMHGYWEMWVTMWLAKRVKPGWRCVDVGANFGYYTVLLADLVGEHGHVEAWEPNSRLVARLTPTLRLNGFTERVRVIDAAAGAKKSDEASLVYGLADYGRGTVVENLLADIVACRPDDIAALTRTRRLDDEHRGEPDFVKIDAEGMEPEVWEGLGEFRPKAALIEWTPSKYKNPGVFLGMILDQGYTVGRVNQHGELDPFPNARTEVKAFLAGTSAHELFVDPGWQALWLERET